MPFRSSRCWSESWLSTGPWASTSRIALWRAVFDMNKNADQCISIHSEGQTCQAGNSKAITREGTQSHQGIPVFPPLTALSITGCTGGNLKVHAPVVVGFVNGWEVEVGKQDLVGPVRGEVKECIAHDGVLEDFGPITVFETEDGGRLLRHWRCGARSVRFRHRMAVFNAFTMRIRAQRAGASSVVDFGRAVVG